jgi:hypothetical protein
MDRKIKYYALTIILALLLIISTAKSQDVMDFEDFMGMMSETLSEAQLNELSYNLPWNIKVSGYAYGDFSGDGKDDIVLSIIERDETPRKSVDVYFFENVDNQSYKRVKKKNYKWYEVTLEVAFLVKEGKCFVTFRDDNYWYFSSFEIQNEKLISAGVESFPIEFENAGN